MSDRKEPTISPLNLDKDDARPSRARASSAPPPNKPAAGAAASNNNVATSNNAAAANRRPAPVSQRQAETYSSQTKSATAIMALVLAVIGLGGMGFGAWQYLQLQQQFAQQAQLLDSAEERVTALEQRLSLSDDESTQSITVIQAKVKENDSEIRKLWGVAYDRNRKAIAALEVGLDDVKQAISKASTGSQNKINELSGELRVLSELIEAQQANVSAAASSYKEQKANLEAVVQKLNALDSELRKKVNVNEEAIKAIDAFRVQVNRDLLQLKGG